MKPIKKSKKPKNDKLVKRVYQPEKHIEIPPAEGVDKYKILEEQKIIRAMVVEKISSKSSTPLDVERIKKTIGRDPIMSPKEILSFVHQVKLATEYLSINGKKYKEGAIVDIQLNPYMNEPNARQPKKKKSILNDLQDITKGGRWIKEKNWLEEQDVVGPDDEGELPDEEDGGMGKKIRDDGEEEGVDYGDDDEPEEEVAQKPSDEIDEDQRSPEKVSGKDVVEEHDFEFGEEVTKFDVGAFSQFGLEYRQTKLVPVLRKDKARPQAKVAFGKSEKFEVIRGPNGTLTLKHYTPFGYDGATEFEKPDVVVRAPRKPEIPVPRGEFKIGDYVHYKSFVITSQIEGIVTSTGQSSFNLISIGDYPKRYIDVDYRKVSNVKVLPFPENVRSGKTQITVANVNIHINTKECKSELCKNIKPGTYIKFKLTKSHQKRYGYITGFEDEHYIILTENGRVNVPFTEKLEHHDRPKQRLEFKPADPEVVLTDLVIPGTRERVITIIFELLARVFDNKQLYISNLEIDTRLGELSQKIDWILHHHGNLKWDAYYNVKFNEWLYRERFLRTVHGKIPNYSQYAKDARADQLSPDYAAGYVKELTDKYGDDIFNGNGLQFITKVEELSQKSGFENTQLTSFIRTEFNRISKDKLESFSGEMLARIITRCLLKYREIYTPSAIEIKTLMESQWLQQEFQKFRGREVDQKEFDQLHLIAISDEFKELTDKYTRNEELVSEYNTLKEDLREKYVRKSKELEEGGLTLNGKVLSKDGVKLYEDIVTLEVQIYELHGENNLEYLTKVLEIALFLDPTSRLGKYAEYFRAKIRAENYHVKNLASSTIYHAFPEFFINQNLSDREYILGVKLLKRDLFNGVIDFVNDWILQHISSIPTISNLVGLNKKGWKDWNNWRTYTTSVSTVCALSKRIKKGANLSGDPNNLTDYECENTENGVKKCTAKREPISLEDTILCYSDGKFVCLSINDVLYALADKKRGETHIANPITGVEYTQDFLDRMELRYGDEVDSEKYPHRVLEFEIKETSAPKTVSKKDISKKSKSKRVKK